MKSHWEVVVDGRVVGTATAGDGPDPSARFVRLRVDPDYQRRGIGRSLFEEVRRDLRSANYTTVFTIVVVGTDGDRLATKYGADVADELVVLQLNLADVDVDTLTSHRHALPAEYALAHWSDRAPDRLVRSYAKIRLAIADAPNRFPPVVPPWDEELIRKTEGERAERGEITWISAAVDDRTGDVVAFTEITANASPNADQGDTVVLSEYRRHGLATCVKADAILRLRSDRPDIETIGTTSAVANAGMCAVNTRLGFRELHHKNLVRIPLDQP